MMNHMNMIFRYYVTKNIFGWMARFWLKTINFFNEKRLIFGSSIYMKFILTVFCGNTFKNIVFNEHYVLECTRVYIANFLAFRLFLNKSSVLNEHAKFIQVHRKGSGMNKKTKEKIELAPLVGMVAAGLLFLVALVALVSVFLGG